MERKPARKSAPTRATTYPTTRDGDYGAPDRPVTPTSRPVRPSPERTNETVERERAAMPWQPPAVPAVPGATHNPRTPKK